MFNIEFVGGPYDGHQQVCLLNITQLPLDVVWPVCENAFQQLAGEVHCQGGTMTSVALYELVTADGIPQYRFSGAITFKDFEQSIRNFC